MDSKTSFQFNMWPLYLTKSSMILISKFVQSSNPSFRIFRCQYANSTYVPMLLLPLQKSPPASSCHKFPIMNFIYFKYSLITKSQIYLIKNLYSDSAFFDSGFQFRIRWELQLHEKNKNHFKSYESASRWSNPTQGKNLVVWREKDC